MSRASHAGLDAPTGVLRMTSGSSNGLACKLMPEGSFRVLDQKGNVIVGNRVHVPKAAY